MGVAKNQIIDVWEEIILPSIIINVHKLNTEMLRADIIDHPPPLIADDLL